MADITERFDMPVRYCPMLKTRKGEATALENLTAATKQSIMPVLHATTSIAASFIPDMARAWGNGRIAVDGTFAFNTNNSVSNFNTVLRGLRGANMDAIPSIAVSADQRLVQAAASQINNSGVVIRSQVDELPQVAAFVASLGTNPANVDLFVVVGHIVGMPINALASLIANSLNQHVGAQHPYRSITLAAAAAPKDHGDLPRGRNVVPRHDLALFRNVENQVQFDLDYADYAIGHPDLTEPPGYAMARATVSARYADQNNWIIIKGRSTGGQSGIPMSTQYSNHASAFVAEPTFGQVPGCWADQEIQQIAVGVRNSGNRTTWAGFGINRHIEVTVDQL